MKNMIVMLVVAGLLAAGAVYWFVVKDDDTDIADSTQSTQVVELAKSDSFPLGLTFSGLQPLNSGVYEGWVVRAGVKYSFGTFNTTDEGAVVGEMSLTEITPQNGDKVVISIEPDNDTDPESSATIILAGDLVDGTASLTFPVDVSGYSGQYILGTPTSATDDDELSGIWFTATGSDQLLDIPVAPAGWIYEGWVVVNSTPVSSGQFSDPNAADLFDGYSGPGSAPNKPGEDYAVNLPNGLIAPLNLTDGSSSVVLSLEPFQDGEDPTGPVPAQVKPLSAKIAADSTDHTPYDLTLSTASVPSGSASL